MDDREPVELQPFSIQDHPQVEEIIQPGLISISVEDAPKPELRVVTESTVAHISIRSRIYLFMTDSNSSRGAFAWNIFILLVIVSSIVIFCLETLPAYYSEDSVSPWSELEVAISSIFTVDVALRLLTCPSYLLFFKDPFTWIDILSIVPFYVELIFSSGVSGLKVIRVVRLCRVFRIFRLGKYSNSLVVVLRTFVISWNILAVLLIISMLLIISFGTFIFLLERGSWSIDQKSWLLGDSKSSFQDIRDALWFCVITSTTVGYGDIFPVTGWGKLFSGALIFIGTLSLAFPITAICSNFTLEWTELKKSLAKKRQERKSKRKKNSPVNEPPQPIAQSQEPHTLREKIFLTFDDSSYSAIAQKISIGMLLLVIVSIIVFIIGSVEEFYRENETALFAVESVIIGFFTFDYVIRVATCNNRIRYMLRPFNIIDMLSIIPYYIDLISGSDVDGLSVLRILRLIRVFRVFRLGKYSQGFEILTRTLVRSIDELGLLVFLLMVLLVLSSSIMYYVERGSYVDDRFCESYDQGVCIKSKYESVVLTFWWCIATISTLGYGDVFPKTILGRGVTSITALLGIMTLAFPIAVLGNNFSEEWKSSKPSELSQKLARRAQQNSPDDNPEQNEIHEMNRAKSLFALHPRKLYFTFTDPEFSPTAYILSIFYLALVLLSVITFCYESTTQEGSVEANNIAVIETVVIALFTLEYVISVFFAPSILRNFKSLSSIIDLVSILPFYIELVISGDTPGLAVLRVIRLARIFRMFRVSKVAENFRMIALTLLKSFDALLLLVLVISLEVIIFSSAMFYAERGTYEEGKGWYLEGERSNYQSVPESFWWAIVTICTVGYGDVVPVTIAGRIIAGLTVISGILSLAFPITIISNTFMDEWVKNNISPQAAPASTPLRSADSTQLTSTNRSWTDYTRILLVALHFFSGIIALLSMLQEFQSDDVQRIMFYTQSGLIAIFLTEQIYKRAGQQTICLDLYFLVDFFSIAVLVAAALGDKRHQGLLTLQCAHVLRLFHLFPKYRMSRDYKAVVQTLQSASSGLIVIATLELIYIIFFSTIMWYLERGSLENGVWIRDGERSPFQSIPHSFWWSIVTMATVGYGDMAPTTIAGRIVAGFIILTGILVLALPIAVLSANFTQFYECPSSASIPSSELEVSEDNATTTSPTSFSS